MDFYDAGCDVDEASQEDNIGWEHFGVKDVREKVYAVARLMSATDTDVVASKPSKDFLDAWTSLWISWNRFYDRFTSLPGVVSQFHDSTWRQADIFQGKAVSFRNALAKLKKPVTPLAKILPPKRSVNIKFPSIDLPQQNISDNGFPWKWALIGSGAALAVYLGYKYYTAPKRLIAHHEQETTVGIEPAAYVAA